MAFIDKEGTITELHTPKQKHVTVPDTATGAQLNQAAFYFPPYYGMKDHLSTLALHEMVIFVIPDGRTTWLLSKMRPGIHYVQVKPDLQNIEQEIRQYIGTPAGRRIATATKNLTRQLLSEQRIVREVQTALDAACQSTA